MPARSAAVGEVRDAGRLAARQRPRLASRPPPGAAFCYVIGADVDPATLGELLPLEDYADCWRGAVQCVADAPPNYGDGPHACRAGDSWLFGDLVLMERVRPAAEAVHFGSYRGIGAPGTAPPQTDP